MRGLCRPVRCWASRPGRRRGIDAVVDADDVRIVEHANDLPDRVGLADVGQELVPSPAPSDAPFTMPAMSTNDTTAGTSFTELWIFASSALQPVPVGLVLVPVLGLGAVAERHLEGRCGPSPRRHGETCGAARPVAVGRAGYVALQQFR